MLSFGLPAQTRSASKTELDISRYIVKRTLGPIHIDGALEEPSWNAAASTGPFSLNEGKGLPAEKTIAKMLWDDQNLYFAFQCEDTDIFATMKIRDQHLWEEEVVEVFIDPDGDQANYIELEINPLNTFLDLFVLKPIVPIPYESYNIPAKMGGEGQWDDQQFQRYGQGLERRTLRASQGSRHRSPHAST